MSDGLPKELTPGEKVFINSFLREPPQWIRWVKKTNPKNTIQPRLMVVTKYRVYSIKRNKMGKKQIVREDHLFNLKEVSTDDLDRCVLVFKDFKIVAHAQNLGVDLPRVVLQCFYNISYTFSEAAFPKVTMSPAERTPPEIDRIAPGPAAGFEEVYLAQCDFLGAAASPDIIIMADDLFAAGNTFLDLDKCTGIEKDHQYSINLAPVYAALRHNNYFTGFSIHDKSRANEAVRGIADILSHNITLTSVDISGMECGSDEAWEAFGDALRANLNNVLANLNLSGNPFGEKGIIPICLGLSSINHPMYTIDVSSTSMQAKGITQFFRTLLSNLTLSTTLYDVNVSNNAVAGGPLGVSLSDWLVGINDHCGENKQLRKLNLSACAIDFSPAIDQMRNFFTITLDHIDLSHNKIEEYHVQLLISLLGKSTSLHHLNLSFCGLTAGMMTAVINAASPNAGLVNFELDLSGNDMSREDQSIISFSGAIARSMNIHTLKIAEMNLKKETLVPLCKAIGENASLISLDFSGNFKHGTLGGKGENPLEILVASVKTHPTLTALSIAGRNEFQLFKEMLPLFKLLIDNHKLLELDVSHNKFGDDGARELFDILRTNYCLKTLSFDHNNITYPGWQALRRCILVNRSLVDLKYPKKDITKTINFAKDKVDMHEKLRDLFIEVAIFTQNNATGLADARPLQPSPKPPLPVPPFELFLSSGSSVYTPSSPGTYHNSTGYSSIPVNQSASHYNIGPINPSTPTPQTGTYAHSPPPPGGAHAPISRAQSVYAAPSPPSSAYGSPSMRPASMYPSQLTQSASLSAIPSYAAAPPPPPPPSSAAPLPPSFESDDSYSEDGSSQSGSSYEPPSQYPPRLSNPNPARPISVMGQSPRAQARPPHATVSYGTSPLSPPPPTLKAPPPLSSSPSSPPSSLAPPPPLKTPSLPGNMLKGSGGSGPPSSPPPALPPVPPSPGRSNAPPLPPPPPLPPAEENYDQSYEGDQSYNDQSYGDQSYTDQSYTAEGEYNGEYPADQNQYYDNQGTSEEVEDLTNQPGARNSQQAYYY